jgi:peroxiredoxin
MNRRSLTLAIGLALVLVLASLAVARLDRPAAATGATAASVEHARIEPGFAAVSRPAPMFDLPQLDGRGTVALSRLHGKPVVINFWASTCTICRQESPAIARVARATRGRVDYVGVDTMDSRAAALAFVRRHGISYPIAFDPAGAAAARYGVPGLPVTFFLSPTGEKIIGVNVGALTARGLTAILRRLYGPV